MSDDRRREQGPRIELTQAITLINCDGVEIRVLLKDLSRDGFRIAHRGEDLSAGEMVILKTGRTDARAQLSWVTKDEAGGMFVDRTPV